MSDAISGYYGYYMRGAGLFMLLYKVSAVFFFIDLQDGKFPHDSHADLINVNVHTGVLKFIYFFSTLYFLFIMLR